eukprot:TRINITY_DN4411_c0_g1_i3.p1 TRINITY_DN4411_c0_g1~~TRINITY_DN4411_c0_g1_i3.p1  ORF type:complete len:263 (+),score=26.33 TRINITY_DN4411_c0_g1_i3:229-1017(+)
MATMDQMNVGERHRLASVGAVALNWRAIARLLPGVTQPDGRLLPSVTEDDVRVRLPPGSTDLDHSAKFFQLLSERQVSQDDVWAAMAEAGLQARLPTEATSARALSGETIARAPTRWTPSSRPTRTPNPGTALFLSVRGRSRSQFRISAFNLPLPRSDIRIVRRAAIDDSLTKNAQSGSSNVVIVTACGLGGVGKTTALFRYVHDADSAYSLRANPKTPTFCRSSFLNLASSSGWRMRAVRRSQSKHAFDQLRPTLSNRLVG